MIAELKKQEEEGPRAVLIPGKAPGAKKIAAIQSAAQKWLVSGEGMEEEIAEEDPAVDVKMEDFNESAGAFPSDRLRARRDRKRAREPQLGSTFC